MLVFLKRKCCTKYSFVSCRNTFILWKIRMIYTNLNGYCMCMVVCVMYGLYINHDFSVSKARLYYFNIPTYILAVGTYKISSQ